VNRFFFLSLVICGFFLLGLMLRRGDLVALGLPLLLYLLVGLWRAPDQLDLEVQRDLSAERVDAGVPVTVNVTVTNRGSSLDELFLEDKLAPELAVSLGSPRHLITLGRDESYRFSYSIAGPRGRYTFEALRAEAWDAFGLFQRRQSFAAARQLFVFPQVTRLKYVAIRPRRTRVYAGSIPARQGGAGVEFFGVRAYRTGDPPRSINWRASARHPGDLLANEYQQERVADVGVVLDGRVRTNSFGAGRSLFEHSVLAAAALSDAFLQQGNRVGLLVYGAYLEWSFPGYGKVQRERILHTLARAQVGASSVFAGLDHLSPRLFPAESQIVLISPLVAEDVRILVSLRARGHQVLVLSPDPVAFERRILEPDPHTDLAARLTRLERVLLVRRLQRAGIQVIEWDVAMPFDQAVRPALLRLRAPQWAGRMV